MKIGDKVKIAKVFSKKGCTWVTQMSKFLNQEVTIDLVNFDNKTFCIKEEDSGYDFPFECLEESDLDYKIRVMQAFKEGKEIESYDTNGFEIWNLDKNPTWNWYFYNYRIKQEPEYIPFDFSDAESLIGKVVKRKNINEIFMLSYFYNVGTLDYSYTRLFNDFTFLDGSPCGKLKQ